MNFSFLLVVFSSALVLGMDTKPETSGPLERDDLFTRSLLAGIRYDLANVSEFLEPLHQIGIDCPRLFNELELLKGPSLAQDEDIIMEGFSFRYLYKKWRETVYNCEMEPLLRKVLNETFGDDPDLHHLLATFEFSGFEPAFIQYIEDFTDHLQFAVAFLDGSNASPRSYNLFFGMIPPGISVSYPFFDRLVRSKNIDAKTVELLFKHRFKFDFGIMGLLEAMTANCHDAIIIEYLKKGGLIMMSHLSIAIMQNRPSEIILQLASKLSFAPHTIDTIVEVAIVQKYDEDTISALMTKVDLKDKNELLITAKENGYSQDFIDSIV